VREVYGPASASSFAFTNRSLPSASAPIFIIHLEGMFFVPTRSVSSLSSTIFTGMPVLKAAKPKRHAKPESVLPPWPPPEVSPLPVLSRRQVETLCYLLACVKGPWVGKQIVRISSSKNATPASGSR